jgi:hypothetical protein
MGLDRADGTACLSRNLVEAQVAEEPEGDDLSIRLVEPRDRRPDTRGAFGTQRADRRVRATGHVDSGGRIGRVDPAHLAATLRSTNGDPDRDARDPGAEGSLAAPAGEAAEGSHERLLRGILGLVEIPEDAVAGADDRGRFAIDEEPERIAIASQDSLDSGAFIDDLGVGNWW